MKALTTKPIAAIVLTSSIFSADLRAEEFNDADVFVGGSMSYNKLDNLSISSNDVSVPEDINEFDDDRHSWKAFAGVWFNSWLGVEGQYLDLGEFESAGTKVDPTGKTLSLLVGLPLTEQTRLYAKGGRMWWETDVNGPLGFDTSREGDTMFYGVGLSAGILPNVNLRAEYERAKFDDDNFEADLDFASLGAEFIF